MREGSGFQPSWAVPVVATISVCWWFPHNWPRSKVYLHSETCKSPVPKWLNILLVPASLMWLTPFSRVLYEDLHPPFCVYGGWCMCVHLCVFLCMHNCVCVWEPRVNDGNLLQSRSALVFEKGALTEPGAHWFSKSSCQRVPGFLCLPPQCWHYRCTLHCPALYMCCR